MELLRKRARRSSLVRITLLRPFARTPHSRLASLGKGAPLAVEAHRAVSRAYGREDQDCAREELLRKGRRSEDQKPVCAGLNQIDPEHCTKNMELPSRQGDRAEKTGGEDRQQEGSAELGVSEPCRAV